MKSTDKQIMFLLLIPGTLWGLSFAVQEIVLQTIPPFTLTMGRAFIAALPLLMWLYMRGGRLPSTFEQWKPYVVLGFLNNSVPFVLISWGQLYIDSSLATILTSLMPLFTVVLAHFFSEGERLNSYKATGVVLGLVGILVLIGPSALAGLNSGLWGQLAVIAAALSYAVAGIYARQHLQRRAQSALNSILELTSCQYITSTVSLVPFVLLIDRPWELQPSQASIMALLTLAWVITLGAVLIYYYIIDAAGASVASTTVYLIPMTGVFFGAWLLNEVITWNAIVALGLILSGIALVNEVGRKKVVAVAS